MMTTSDIHELNAVSSLLAGGLAEGSEMMDGVPLEVLQGLAEAREQMRNLPEVIDSLNLAFERFNTVSSALNRMIELADRASGRLDERVREELNGQFVSLAKIVAADAGRQYYAGPRLNLKNEGEALSAARIIRYMNPVIETMSRELTEQKDLIHEVIGETINFLGIVTQCYPESEGASRLGELIRQANFHRQPVSTSAGMLH